MPTPHAITMLIIEDSPEDREVYKAYLSQFTDCTYTILEADSAEAGLKICDEVNLDCILLDYELPDLNGADCLAYLKEHRIAVPVIMITGRGSESVAVQCLKLGAVDYIAKSKLAADTLFRAIRNATEVARLQARVAQQEHDRKVAENDLRQSEARFRLLVNSVKDYTIVMLEANGSVSSWNAGARDMFDYHDNEIMGIGHDILFLAEDVETGVPWQDLKRAAKQQRVAEDRWYVRRDGRRFWGSSVLTPFADPSGELQGYAWVLRDETRRRAELDGKVASCPQCADRDPEARPGGAAAGRKL